MDRITFHNSPLGQIRLLARGDCLTELRFVGQQWYKDVSAEEGECPVLLQAKRWLDEYFAGKWPDFMPKLLLNGTEFQKSVWRHLMEIPYGQTRTYGFLAKEIAGERGLKSMSAQAVGNAAGRNPILLMVPCHRLIGSNGSLTGFAAGIEIKKELLTIEKILLP